jgi:hypothetical protein
MWTYHQSSGLLEHDGKEIWNGYSGSGVVAANNPLYERIPCSGPIPHGLYRLSGNRLLGPQQRGSDSASVAPVGHDAAGRQGFMLHADYYKSDPAKGRVKGDASEGCIILPPDVRRQIWTSGDHLIFVTPI